MVSQSDKALNHSASRLQINWLILLRLVIGWHFLYEGIAKLLTPGWTSAPYLSTSRWLLSPFFNWIATNSDLLIVADWLNIWGLILIGFGLILGVFIKTAAIAGMVLLALYYIAHPPFVGMDFGIPLEGHYVIVNKTLIEIIALGILAVFPAVGGGC